jgi:sensor histidine kinase regulating citrate/malate metabolism
MMRLLIIGSITGLILGAAVANYQQMVKELKKKGEKEISKTTEKCREQRCQGLLQDST